MKQPKNRRFISPRACVSCKWYRVYEESNKYGGFETWFCARNHKDDLYEYDPGDLMQFYTICDLYKRK